MLVSFILHSTAINVYYVACGHDTTYKCRHLSNAFDKGGQIENYRLSLACSLYLKQHYLKCSLSSKVFFLCLLTFSFIYDSVFYVAVNTLLLTKHIINNQKRQPTDSRSLGINTKNYV